VPEEAERPARRGAIAITDGSMRARADRRVLGTLLFTAIGLVIGVALVTWLATRDDGGASPPQRAAATAASIRTLNVFAGSIRHPVYWAGAQPRFTYELSRTRDGRVYVRYLPPGVKLGDPEPNYLTVGTYPQRRAFATLRATATKQQARVIRLPGGGLAIQDRNRPASVYLAYPRSDYQIEVFDPKPGRARELVASGQVKAVGAPPRAPTGSRAASVQQLKSLAVALGHPIYWAGEAADTTYELTRTRDGSVYVRYLPVGVAVGDRRPEYLTIGTYPQRSALATLRATAAKNQVKTTSVENGGAALVDRKHPTSVYVAFPGVDLQIEVYDPTPDRARQLVSSGQIAPIR
jgi:hypothetical protein